MGQGKGRKETGECAFYRLRVIKWKALFITQGTLLRVTWQSGCKGSLVENGYMYIHG